MTREEAVDKLSNRGYACSTVDAKFFIRNLELLGLIKFDENKVEGLFARHINECGTIRLEKWPEGYCLWIGDKIVYTSWKA